MAAEEVAWTWCAKEASESADGRPDRTRQRRRGPPRSHAPGRPALHWAQETSVPTGLPASARLWRRPVRAEGEAHSSLPGAVIAAPDTVTPSIGQELPFLTARLRFGCSTAAAAAEKACDSRHRAPNL